MDALRTAQPSPKPGFITRSYPAVLERMHSLSDAGFRAALLLFDVANVGDVVEIVHRQFYRSLCRRDETSSRRAFESLVTAGIVRCVFRQRGRFGRTIYRLEDAAAAYARHGLRAAEPSDQLRFDFDLESCAVEDLGGGILRLFVPGDVTNSTTQCGGIAALNAPDSARSECGGIAALNSAALDTDHGKRNSATSFSPPKGDDGSRAKTRSEASGTEVGRKESCSSQSNSRQWIESGSSPESERFVTSDDAAAGEPGTDHPASPAPLRHGRFETEPPAEFGTPPASRALRELNSLKENSYTPPNSIQPNSIQQRAAPAQLRASDDVPEIEAKLAESVAREVLRAVRAAESRAGIPANDRQRAMGHYVAVDWGRAVADHTLSRQHVRELCDDIARITEWRVAPGALVWSRLNELYQAATGEPLRRRPK